MNSHQQDPNAPPPENAAPAVRLARPVGGLPLRRPHTGITPEMIREWQEKKRLTQEGVAPTSGPMAVPTATASAAVVVAGTSDAPIEINSTTSPSSKSS